MRTESLGRSYLAFPDAPGPFPGVVVVHEASGLNDNIRDICGRFAAEGYAALGVDLFEGRNRAVCMARMFVSGMAGNLDYYGVPALKAALGQLASRPEVDGARIGAIGFCLGGSIVLTWACTDNRLAAIAPFYGTAPKPREAIRRMCPAVGSWPGKDFTTKAAGVLETELTAASIPHDLKVYPGAKHAFFNDQWRAYHPAAGRGLLAAGPGLFRRACQAGPAVTGATVRAEVPAGPRRSPGIASGWSRFCVPCGRPVARTAGQACASSLSGAPASPSS
jgi:carboxymethylenebutenolidase